MTELLTRPRPTTAYDDVWSVRSVWLRGALGAMWAVAVGLASLIVIVLLTWATDSRAASGAGSAVRAGLQVWLLGHRVPLHIGAGTLAIAPLLLTLCFAALVARAAGSVARADAVTDGRGVVRVMLAVGLPYAVLTTFVAAAATASSVHPSPVAALGCGLLLGCLAAAWGAARGAEVGGGLWAAIPERVRVPIGAGIRSVLVLAAGAALLLLAALVVHGASVTNAVTGLGGGGVAATVIVALNVALLPNAVVCVLGYIAGPGFAVGAGADVTLTGAHPGSLPALPLLEAMPDGPASAVVGVFAIAVVVAAGALAARRIARAGWALGASMTAAAGAGASAGALAALLAAVAGGPAGPGRMATVGVSPWQVGLVVAAEVAVVAAGVVGAMTWRRGR